MKKIIILLVIFSGMMVTSCNDDFLNRTPEDKISDPNFWRTAEHLKLYVNNFYNRDDLLKRFGDWGTSPFTVDADNGSDTQVRVDFDRRMNSEETVPVTGGGWAIKEWQPLRDINYFFANYGNATGEEGEINKYVGEAYFFRTLFYFEKIKRFGDVPFYPDLVSIEDEEKLYKARDSRKYVVEELMKDMDKAVSYLPSIEDGWTGRITKEAAMILQARLALFEGTWEKYHAGTDFGVEGSNG